jgi:hypothetical protein
MALHEGSALGDQLENLERVGEDLEQALRHVDAGPAEDRLVRLKDATDRIGRRFPIFPTRDPRYLAQWSEFLRGKRYGLERGTVRSLCWEPDVATSVEFHAFLKRENPRLGARPLAGLVRSCHKKWEDSVPESDVVAGVRALIARYDGPSPVILKWTSHLDAVLGPKAPEMLGRSLVEAQTTLTAFLLEWYLDDRSPFVRRMVEAATAVCNDYLSRPTRPLLELLFGELLRWPLWDPEFFKREVARLILSGSVAGQTKDILQTFIIGNSHLGDPRISSNDGNWRTIPPQARKRMILWLSENPFQLQDRVYREGRGWSVRTSTTTRANSKDVRGKP